MTTVVLSGAVEMNSLLNLKIFKQGAVEMNSLLNLKIFKLYAKLQLQGKNQAVVLGPKFSKPVTVASMRKNVP